MKLHLNITGKLAFLLVSFGAVLLGSLSALAYVNGRAGLQQAATAELRSTAFEKRSALERWFAEARIDITAKSTSPVVVEQAASLLAASPGSPEALAAHDRLIAEFQPTIGPETVFIDLLFIHPDTGEVLASTDPREEGKFKESMSFFINGRVEPYVSEAYYSTSLGRPAIAAAAPVFAEDGRLLGVLAGRLDMNILNSLISQRTGLRYSDDSYLVNDVSLLVTQPRFMSDPVVLKRTIRTEAVMRCLDGNSGVALYEDYRGTLVIGDYRWLPTYRVCLIVKIDQDEAFASSLAFGHTIALTGGLALVFAIALAIMLARNFARPILDLQTGVKRVGQGDLDYRVTVKSRDEIGLLAAAFNEMIASLEKQVAERKQAEQALARSYDLLSRTGQMAKVGGWELDLETQTLSWSEEVYRIHEVDPATRLDVAEAINFYTPEAQPVISAAVQAAIDSGTSWDLELPLITAQGRRIWARAQGAAERRDGRTVRLFGAFQDITERKQAEEKIRIQAARTASLLHVAELLNAQLDLDTVLTTICREAAKVLNAPAGFINLYDLNRGTLVFSGMFGLPEEFGRRYVAPPYELFKEYVARMGPLFVVQDVQALADQKVPNLELYRSVNARTIANAVLQRSNELIGVLSMVTFAEERQFRDDELALLGGLAHQATQAIANARLFSDLQTYTSKLEQSNRDLQEFAYVASHDLQEPLRKVQAFSDRLATKYTDALDDTGRDYLKRMRDASQRMQTLINNLLGFSRVSTRAQPFTEVDLNTVAREVLSDLENQIERTQTHIETGELPTIQADPTQMHQLLQNLIGNALKFHHEERPPLIRVSTKIEKDTCVISVEDNGIGFDPQYLDRIFKPFQRLHNREEYEGSGMGLAICRRIVERHGGSITAASTPGKGAAFLVTLPIHQPQGGK